MNESQPLIPPVPPPFTDVQRAPRNPPLGELPEDRVPISTFTGAIESILRQPRRMMYQLRQAGQGSLFAYLLLLTVICSAIYGLVVGTFSLHEQLWAAPVKVVVGLLLSGFICLPSLYIFSALSGSQARLVDVFGMLVGLLALSTILLVGFAPVAWVFSQSTQSVPAMGALHLIFYLIATYFGLRFLCHGLKHLGLRSTSGLAVWMIIFLLVAMQMTTALRPIVGTSKTFLPALTEKKFFLTHWADCMAPTKAPNAPKAAERQVTAY